MTSGVMLCRNVIAGIESGGDQNRKNCKIMVFCIVTAPQIQAS